MSSSEVDQTEQNLEDSILDLSSKSPSLSSEDHESPRTSVETEPKLPMSLSIPEQFLSQHASLLTRHIDTPSSSLLDSKQTVINPFSLLQTTTSPFYNAFDSLALANAFQSSANFGLYNSSSESLSSSSLNTAPWGMYLNHLSSRKRKKMSSTMGEESVPLDKASKSDDQSDSKKSDDYWDRRRKNNEAAKRSRDARRKKEEEIAIRAAYLEQENLKLRAQVTILKNESAKLHFLLYNRTNNSSNTTTPAVN